jgi:hypothetical protein
MRTVTVQERQTLFDIAIRYCGDVGAIFEIMQLNDVSITDALSGQTLTVPDTYARRITDYYQSNNIEPATAYIEVKTENNGIITNDNQYNLITNDNNNLIIPNNG